MICFLNSEPGSCSIYEIIQLLTLSVNTLMSLRVTVKLVLVVVAVIHWLLEVTTVMGSNQTTFVVHGRQEG